MVKYEPFLIQALGPDETTECLESMEQTAAGRIHGKGVKIIPELETREATLNHILDIRNREEDCLIIVDDIRFLPDWDLALDNGRRHGDIIGFSMLEMDGKNLQDFGYDFIEIDGLLSYQGLHKHCRVGSVDLPAFRVCDAITGCAMLITAGVLDAVDQFPLEGANRWGELLFSHLARRQGFRTIVLSQHLLHGADSTKQKRDPQLGSISWMIERRLWETAVRKHMYDVQPLRRIERRIDDSLRLRVQEAKSVLFYGCGTIADHLIKSLAPDSFDVCSGLVEEVGVEFNKRIVQHVEAIDSTDYELVVITPIGYDVQILPLFPRSTWNRMIGIKELKHDTSWFYRIRQIEG